MFTSDKTENSKGVDFFYKVLCILLLSANFYVWKSQYCIVYLTQRLLFYWISYPISCCVDFWCSQPFKVCTSPYKTNNIVYCRSHPEALIVREGFWIFTIVTTRIVQYCMLFSKALLLGHVVTKGPWILNDLHLFYLGINSENFQ